jgi:XamI restriction endonuclease
VATATANFRRERLDEPLERYSENFERAAAVFAHLVDRLPELHSSTLDVDLIADFMRNEDTRRAFRYLTAPPISEGDLQTLAEATLAPTVLRRNPENAHRIRDIVCRILDPHRFPWIAQNRDPLPQERATAIVASAALVAAKRVEMFRRMDAKDRQEGKVKALIAGIPGFTEVARRPIPASTAAPKPNEFMGETALAGDRADVVATLRDGRILAIECKVSNTAVNSFKRVVLDTGGKATTWYREIGRANVIACAVLSGVFSPANLATVQNDKDVFLFWDHRLDDLRQFIESVN